MPKSDAFVARLSVGWLGGRWEVMELGTEPTDEVSVSRRRDCPVTKLASVVEEFDASLICQLEADMESMPSAVNVGLVIGAEMTDPAALLLTAWETVPIGIGVRVDGANRSYGTERSLRSDVETED